MENKLTDKEKAEKFNSLVVAERELETIDRKKDRAAFQKKADEIFLLRHELKGKGEKAKKVLAHMEKGRKRREEAKRGRTKVEE